MIDVENQRSIIATNPAEEAAEWFDGLVRELWQGTENRPALEIVA